MEYKLKRNTKLLTSLLIIITILAPTHISEINLMPALMVFIWIMKIVMGTLIPTNMAK